MWKAVFLPVEKPYTTPHCMTALEQAMKTGPADVFWLQERWKTFVKRFRPFDKWLTPDAITGAKRHRALIWLAGVPESWRPPENWFHPDVIYEAAVSAGSRAPDWLPEKTRTHSLPSSESARAIEHEIRALDAIETLPIDFILTRKAAPALKQAAATAMIPLVSLS
jgi:hypothetical protein